MDLETFLVRLEDTPRTWGLFRDRALRTPEGHCPITALRGEAALPLTYGRTWAEADLLGLPHPLARKIAAAADGASGELRRRLLKAVGLAEEG